ncbi:MAG: hypothetical protein LAT64_06030 [Phycisphaerales bacterium]|nr:hypothetical protein [Planctomycetota bacterium]MCH8508313.1 hypothetical protein [Phycisphaerales bacterium]
MQPNHFPRLSQLHILMRLGVVFLTLVLLGGYVVSGIHMAWYYEKRDGVPGLTIDDIRAHYHGVTVPSPLINALEDGHPEDLSERERNILLDWLRNPATLSARYDDFDLGEDAPAEIIATSCISCHARNASGPDAYPRLPLEFFDDIRPLAVSREINPTPIEIIAVSQHTHAPVMAVILLVIALLSAMTRFPRPVVGGIILIGAVGLFADMGAWWLARFNDTWVYAIVGGGFAYSASTGLAGLLIIIDCLIPGPRKPD